MTIFFLQRVASNSPKKWRIIGPAGSVTFGAKGYQDFTQHHDQNRQQLYLERHRGRENWSRAGNATAGFWSRWLLWNKPSLEASIRDIRSRFGFRVVRA
jgi:hypothetical protein